MIRTEYGTDEEFTAELDRMPEFHRNNDEWKGIDPWSTGAPPNAATLPPARTDPPRTGRPLAPCAPGTDLLRGRSVSSRFGPLWRERPAETDSAWCDEEVRSPAEAPAHPPCRCEHDKLSPAPACSRPRGAAHGGLRRLEIAKRAGWLPAARRVPPPLAMAGLTDLRPKECLGDTK